MTAYIFDFVINNNITILYCIKNFHTFIINIRNNLNNNEVNNIINNNNNFDTNYYLFINSNNQQSLFERTNCNINMIEVFQGNYNIQTIEDFKLQNHNLLDNLVWINILGRLALD